MSKGIVERALVVRDQALAKLDKLRDVALLFGRLGVGLVFLSTGWGKVNNVAKVTEFFASLHIPAPGINAVMVGWTELLCGAALVLGVFTRLAAFPLIMSMIVAILTAKRPDIKGFFDLVAFEEFTYIVLLVMIAVLGPGALSIDHALAKKYARAK